MHAISVDGSENDIFVSQMSFINHSAANYTPNATRQSYRIAALRGCCERKRLIVVPDEKVIKVKADMAALPIFFSDINDAASSGVEREVITPVAVEEGTKGVFASILEIVEPKFNDLQTKF